MIIFEEAAIIPKAVWTSIAAPMLAKRETCFVALSTLGHGGKNNHFNRLMKTPGIGTTYSVTYVCDDCVAKKQEKSCRHNLDSLPHFNEESKLNFIQKFFGEENEREFMIETYGIDTINDDTAAFKPDKVQQFIAAPRRGPVRPIRFIMFSVDPVAGSDNSAKRSSDFAMMSLSVPYNIFLGMDALDVVDHSDYDDKLVAHLARIRKLEYCENATIVVSVESGTGLEAGHIHKLITTNFSNVVIMTDGKRTPGRRTTAAVKEEMYLLAREFLESGDLCFHPQWVTSHPEPPKLMAKLRDQLIAYSRIVKESERGRNTIEFTGKGLQKNIPDDLGVDFQLVIKQRADFMRDPQYDKYR